MQLGGNVFQQLAPIPTSIPSACLHTDPAGETVDRRRFPNLELRETVYARGLRLPRHSHSLAYLSYVIEGRYVESRGGSSELCGTGTVRFLPAGEIHSNVYDDGARCLLVGLQSGIVERLREHARILDAPGQVASPKAEWLAKRLYSEFRQRDSAASIAIEGLVLEILAEGVRSTEGQSRNAPRWLHRAKDMINSQFLDVPSLTDIAREAGVHPVHLSREFRRYFDCTVGDYMRKLRVDHASHLLANTRTALADIANICGFADQSHFSSTFKKAVGVTPARFREMHS